MPRTRRDVELLGVDTLHHGRYHFDRYRVRYKTFAGTWSHEVEREMLNRGHTVSVLPYDPLLDQVVLIEQFRPGAFVAGDENPWLWEIVAGVIEKGEQPIEVAHRECEEETGLTPSDMLPIREFYCSPGAVTEYNRVFVGRVAAGAAAGLHGLQDEGEDIRVFTMPSTQAFEAIEQGKIRTTPALVSLAWLKDHRDELRQRWR